MANRLMHGRRAAFLAIAILLLLLLTVAYGTGETNLTQKTGAFGALASSPSYSESLSLYLTSAETFWQASFSGGNVSVPLLSIPSGVSSFSLTLTSYNSWKSSYETFTKNGFGLLGANEPLPDGAILNVNSSSAADASSLASALDQMFALVFAPYTNTSSTAFSFISPMNFQTEVHAYFWKLVPTWNKGFASAFTEQQLESNDLAKFDISYNAGTYSLSIGGLKPLVSTTFSLYSQLGITVANFTYSSIASSSSVAVHVLGGLVSQSNSSYTNHYNNFSASMYAGSSGGGAKVPNLNATLDFSFPTIVATRQIVDLNPTTNQTVGVTVTIKNVSPGGTPPANDVSVNDSWAYSSPGAFSITQGKTSGLQNLSSGQSMSIPYTFTVLKGASGAYPITPIPVRYSFTAANQTVSAEVFLNTETLTINGTGPAIESIASISSGAISAGQSIAVNVTATNKGTATAFNLTSAGQSHSTLQPGQSWTFNATSQSPSLTQANSTTTYSVSWHFGPSIFSVKTNTISSTYSFASPGSPGFSISKTVSYFKSTNTINVSLSVQDTSGVGISNLTVRDSLPSGLTFSKSYDPSGLTFSGGLISGNISSISPNQIINLTYSLSVTGGNENYVFMPANVSSFWNNQSIVHFSQGAGLALGVIASNNVSPSVGFVGSSANVVIGITNQGTLPVYDVLVNQSADPFLALSSSGSSSFKAVLSSGGSLNSSIKANFIGTPGTYNSSSSVASFIFAGYNDTASSNSFQVKIFEPVQSQLSVVSPKIEEDHDIEVMIQVTNPSNVTVSNVAYSMSLPSNLNLKSGNVNFQIPSLAPGAVYKDNITFSTSLPQQYTLNGTLGFQYNGQSLKGQVSALSLTIVDDLTLRYGIPVLVGLVIVVLTLIYLRRLTMQKKVPY